jgi:hypothetical protein
MQILYLKIQAKIDADSIKPIDICPINIAIENLVHSRDKMIEI